VIVEIYPDKLKFIGISFSTGMSLSMLATVVAANTIRRVRDSGGEIISQNVLSWDGNRWRPSEASSLEILYGQKNCLPSIVRIIRGNHHVYSVSSPIYPPTLEIAYVAADHTEERAALLGYGVEIAPSSSDLPKNKIDDLHIGQRSVPKVIGIAAKR
jgi:hypothetical protein